MKLISCSWGRHGGNSGHGEGEIEVARGCEARAVGGGHRCGGGIGMVCSEVWTIVYGHCGRKDVR